MSSICSVAAVATPPDSGASVLGNYHDLLHPNFLVGDEAELAGLVAVDLVPADLDLEMIDSIGFVVGPAKLDDFDESVDCIVLDSMHSSFLVDERAGLVVAELDLADLVALVPTDLEFAVILPIDFVVVAVTLVDFGESLGCIDLDSKYPNFLVDAPVGFLDFPVPVATYLAEAVADPFHFAASAVDIDCDLGCSSLNLGDAVVLRPILAAGHEEKLLS
ncbi:MAG: hypothetical protein K2W97_03310 [Chthoniobacterales bacterium]|nr:hypothetical protein [Chthoniobacterales bacterium]